MSTETRDGLSLDEQLCFALYRATQAIIASYREHLSATGLTYTQYLVMLVLWEVGETNVSLLSSQLGLNSGTLTPVLKRMEKQGLLTRKRDQDDERVVRVRLSEQGRKLRLLVRDARRKVVTDTGLTKQQIAQLRQDLHYLSDQLEGKKKQTS